jgi:hypothetical protein
MRKLTAIIVLILIANTSAHAQTAIVWRNLRGRPADLRGLSQNVTDLEARVSSIETQLNALDARLTALETANLSDDQMLIAASVLLTAIGWRDLARYRHNEVAFQANTYQVGETYWDQNGDEVIWTDADRTYWTTEASGLDTAIDEVGLFTSNFNQKLIDMPANDRTTLIQELQRIEVAISDRIDLILLGD